MKVARYTSILLLIVFSPFFARSQTKPDKDYLVYVLSEGADKIALVRFGPAGIKIDHQIDTGDMPIDIDGPHGIVLSPDRQFYYVTIAHGRPFGSVWKYSTKNDALIGKASLGLFPATLDVSPGGAFLFVVNFNLHGDMTPSSVSVVSTQTMTEIARIRCAEAHQATACTRVLCTHTSSSNRPRMASTSMVSRNSVLTSNDIQTGPIVRKQNARSTTRALAYRTHTLQTVKPAAAASGAKIMVSAA